MEGWYVDSCGSLRHNSGKFFSIEGIHVETDYEIRPSWNQPIINQPEVGYLGILTKEFDGVLYFLIQAKIEPGNVNCVQLSPTLQATKSNMIILNWVINNFEYSPIFITFASIIKTSSK